MAGRLLDRAPRGAALGQGALPADPRRERRTGHGNRRREHRGVQRPDPQRHPRAHRGDGRDVQPELHQEDHAPGVLPRGKRGVRRRRCCSSWRAVPGDREPPLDRGQREIVEAHARGGGGVQELGVEVDFEERLDAEKKLRMDVEAAGGGGAQPTEPAGAPGGGGASEAGDAAAADGGGGEPRDSADAARR